MTASVAVARPSFDVLTGCLEELLDAERCVVLDAGRRGRGEEPLWPGITPATRDAVQARMVLLLLAASR